MQFEFSDSIGGYVKSFDKENRSFVLTTSDGRDFTVKLTPNVYAKMTAVAIAERSRLLRNT